MTTEESGMLFRPSERFHLDANSPIPLYHQVEQIILPSAPGAFPMTCTLRCAMLFSATLLAFLTCQFCLTARAEEPAKPKKIVLIAGKKSHGPGVHEYEKDVKLLRHCLATSPNAKTVKAESYFDGWPQDAKTLDDADAIVLLSDGLDNQYPIQQHPFLKDDHLQVIERQIRRGCGLVIIHWPLWVPSQVGQEKFMPWLGGFCDYQNRPGPGMSDKVDWSRQMEHPIVRGVRPFTFQDEYYGNVRFLGEDPRFTPILPFVGKPKATVWAWAWNREDGGRSFAFIGGHPHKNWEIPELRKTVLNAMLWAAKEEVPAGGVDSTLPDAQPAAQ
jgi:type 1 glutamine amidotransferase